MSALLNIDVIIVVLFLIINFVLGLMSRSTIKSMEEYALGGRDFNTATLAATIVATVIGGFMINYDVSTINLYGILGVLHSIFRLITFIVTGYILSLKFHEFSGKLSAPEVIGDIYGPLVRIITALLSLIAMIACVAVQINVFSIIFSHFLNMDSTYATITSTVVIIIYSAFGGIRAITFTDVFQFYTLGAFIPLLTLIVWSKYGNWEAIIHAINTFPQFNIKSLAINNYDKIQQYTWQVILCLFGFQVLYPALFHKVLLGRNKQQVQTALAITLLIQLLFFIFMAIIGLVLLSVGIEVKDMSFLQVIVDQYSYSGFKGFIIVGIAAMIMSTADSHINSCAVICVNDILNVIGLIKKDNSLSNIKAAQICSIIVGILALSIALWQQGMLHIMQIGLIANTPVLLTLLMIILGFRTTPRVMLLGIIFSILGAIKAYYYSNILGFAGVSGLACGMAVMIGIHYILREPGGWSASNHPTKI